MPITLSQPPTWCLPLVHEHHLRRALTEYLRHYNAARPHRSLGQLTPAQAETQPPQTINLAEHRVHRRQVLGGLTHEYYVAAWRLDSECREVIEAAPSVSKVTLGVVYILKGWEAT